MAKGTNQPNGMQPLYYDPQKNQYMVQEQGNGTSLTERFVPFAGGNGLPNLNPTYNAPKVNFQPSQLLQNQLANAQNMFNSPLAIPQTRNAPKPTIGAKK